MKYLYGEDDPIDIINGQVEIWPDSHAVIQATKDITSWKPINNFQFMRATNPAAAIDWVEKNCVMEEFQ